MGNDIVIKKNGKRTPSPKGASRVIAIHQELASPDKKYGGEEPTINNTTYAKPALWCGLPGL